MKRLLPGFAALGLVLLGACGTTSSAGDRTVRHGDAIGEPLVAQESLELSDVGSLPRPESGEVLLVEGTARDVCAKKGCWMQIEDGGESALVFWKDGCDGRYAFPVDAIGQRVLVQGTVRRAELSHEDVEHMLEEAKQGVDPRRSTLEIRASSVVVLRSAD